LDSGYYEEAAARGTPRRQKTPAIWPRHEFLSGQRIVAASVSENPLHIRIQKLPADPRGQRQMDAPWNPRRTVFNQTRKIFSSRAERNSSAPYVFYIAMLERQAKNKQRIFMSSQEAAAPAGMHLCGYSR